MDNFLIENNSFYLKNILLSDEEKSTFNEKFFALAKRRIELFASLDHSSIKAETAKEIFDGTLFVIETYFQSNKENILKIDFSTAFNEGIKIIEKKIEYYKFLLDIAEKSKIKFQNYYYLQTMKNLTLLPNLYDYNYFANKIPCDIDYQLAFSVDEKILGIDYITEYLKRIIIENKIINSFDKKTVFCLLKKSFVDYKNLCVNLAYPIMTNALGLKILNEDIKELNINKEKRERIAEIINANSEEKMKKILDNSANELAFDLNIFDDYSKEYLKSFAKNLYPYISLSAFSSGLGRIFTKI